MSNIEKIQVSLSEVANTIHTDVPLLIRLFEFAREDATTDQQLHVLTERLVSMSGDEPLTMEQYEVLVQGLV